MRPPLSEVQIFGQIYINGLDRSSQQHCMCRPAALHQPLCQKTSLMLSWKILVRIASHLTVRYKLANGVACAICIIQGI